jgi:adenylate cyclase
MPARGRYGSPGRLTGIVLIIGLAAALYNFEPLRSSLFDFYQAMYPRVRRSMPVVIIAIDERSLQLHGQWPWPRTWLAQIVDRVAEARPAAIGIDILMPEPDRLSPARFPAYVPGIRHELAGQLAGLPSNDAILAQALRGRPVVTGLVGLDAPLAGPSRALPPSHIVPPGVTPLPFVRRHKDALRNLEEIDAAAPGHGLLSADAERGVIRRMPLVAGIREELLPAFGVEMLRVATRQSRLTVRVADAGVDAVRIGTLEVPTEPDGAVLPHFGRHDPSRFVSAADVLTGAANPRLFEKKLVLIGTTAIGLEAWHETPVGERMSGVEIQAQLLEGIFDGELLTRPRAFAWVELGLVLLAGLVTLFMLERVPPWVSIPSGIVLVVALVGVPVGLFRRYGLLLDPIPAVIAAVALAGQQSLVKLSRLGRLRHFFSPQLARLIVDGAADPLETHRREVTVVFLDLRGFTSFADTADPDELMRVLGEFQAEMGRLIVHYEGTLERFTGDGMMIFFNDPVPMPDAAERAVRMAHAMRERVRALCVGWRQRGHGLGFGIGIAQGDAMLGAIGFSSRRDYAAIGTVTNLAARLCGEAQSDQILVSQSLAEAVAHVARLEALGSRTLKGFARPIRVFSVLELQS